MGYILEAKGAEKMPYIDVEERVSPSQSSGEVLESIAVSQQGSSRAPDEA